MHRPVMDWDKATNRHDISTIEGKLFGGFMNIVSTRRITPQLDARYDTDILQTGHSHVFTIANRHPLGTLACIYNFSDSAQRLNVQPLFESGIAGLFDKLSDRKISVNNDVIELAPYARMWLA